MIAGQGVQILSRSRAEIERSVTNVRDATDWGNKLVQKIYTNPFVLSPFYKPSNDDLRVQAVYDTAQVFSKGAQELNDAIKTLEAVQAQVKTPDQQQEVLQLQQKALALTERLGQTSALLAEGSEAARRCEQAEAMSDGRDRGSAGLSGIFFQFPAGREPIISSRTPKTGRRGVDGDRSEEIRLSSAGSLSRAGSANT